MRTYLFLHHLCSRHLARVLAVPQRCCRDQRGQASAEYALVLLGVAAIALLVTAWAARTNRVGRLLDAVMDQLMNRVG